MGIGVANLKNHFHDQSNVHERCHSVIAWQDLRNEEHHQLTITHRPSPPQSPKQQVPESQGKHSEDQKPEQ
ncbi:hypothetical protein J6590_056192 [Homalodisca vitripennis]|nr:hypothetical protein J6590_056192 [Homalodisca vitripennis]